MKNIAIIGAGRLGQAITKILKRKDVEAGMYDADPSKVPGQKSLAELLPGAEIIFLCVPSWVLREAVKQIEPHLKDDAILVLMAKGIEGNTLKRVDELLSELLPKHSHVMVSGPMMAEELANSLSGRGACASIDVRAAEKIKDLFAGTNLVLEHSSDIKSIALAGVLKNVYAMGLGIADALELGENFKGWYVGQALSEMSHIIEHLEGDGKAAYSCAGVGDLVATGFSRHSSNRGVGERLIKKSGNIIGEGYMSLPSVIKLAGKETEKLPILSTLQKIVIEKQDAKQLYEKLAFPH